MLTNKDKKTLLKDYKEWSGGFSPKETTDYEVRMYIKHTLPTTIKGGAAYIRSMAGRPVSSLATRTRSTMKRKTMKKPTKLKQPRGGYNEDFLKVLNKLIRMAEQDSFKIRALPRTRVCAMLRICLDDGEHIGSVVLTLVGHEHDWLIRLSELLEHNKPIPNICISPNIEAIWLLCNKFMG